MIPIPYVIEQTPRGERQYDIYSRLLMDRIIFIGNEITEPFSNLVIAQLLFLKADAPDKEVHMYINSPGGVVTGGLAIYDTMKHIKVDICTYCIGQAASMAAFLLAGGTPGKRFIMKNARVMIHQPLGGFSGQASDIQIHAKEIQRVKDCLNNMMASNTGKSIEEIIKHTERDTFLSPEEAISFGLVDKII